MMSTAVAATFPQDFHSPNWDETKPGDWKRYINVALQTVWASFNAAQQLVIAANAQEQAQREA
jgi:hypothetical protein